MFVVYPHKTKLSSAPTVEPVDASDLTAIKLHLSISDTTWDSYLPGLITAARQKVEGYLKRSLITQTWIAYLDEWGDEIQLPFPPLQSVTSVYYKDSNGTSTLLASSNYKVVTADAPGGIIRGDTVSYPTLQSNTPDVITITYVAGYGASGTNVPYDIVEAIKIEVSNMFIRRDSMLPSNMRMDDSYVKDLIHKYKIYKF